MKVCFIGWFSAQILYFVKNPVPEIEAKILWANQIVRSLNHLFLQNKSMKQPHFLHVDINIKAKSFGKCFGWAMSKYGCSQFGLWTLKLIVSQEWTDGINWFLHFFANSRKFKDWKFFGWTWSKMGVTSLVMGL